MSEDRPRATTSDPTGESPARPTSGAAVDPVALHEECDHDGWIAGDEYCDGCGCVVTLVDGSRLAAAAAEVIRLTEALENVKANEARVREHYLAQLADAEQAIRQVQAEMNEALQCGALFNPEMFGSMLRGNDNPILRWRDALLAARSSVGGETPQTHVLVLRALAAEKRRIARSYQDTRPDVACGYHAEADAMAHGADAITNAPARIACPACGDAVEQVSSATLDLALWQHWNWKHKAGETRPEAHAPAQEQENLTRMDKQP